MRTRLIKPGFFQNDQLGEINPLARLLFAGLWCLADREGRLEDRPKRIKVAVLPYDECNVDAFLTELARCGFIIRYEKDGEHYIQIAKWAKHQQPHYKETASEIPAPDGHVDTAYVAFGISEAERQAIFERDGSKCVNCGSTTKLSLDHIIPRSKGGTDDPDNLQTLCGRCNSAKNNREASATANRGRSGVNSTSVQVQSNVEPKSVDADPLVTSYSLQHPLTGELNTDTRASAPKRVKPPPLEDNFTAFVEDVLLFYPKTAEGRKPAPGVTKKALKKIAVRDWDDFTTAVRHYADCDRVRRGFVMSIQRFSNEEWRGYVEEAAPREIISEINQRDRLIIERGRDHYALPGNGRRAVGNPGQDRIPLRLGDGSDTA